MFPRQSAVNFSDVLIRRVNPSNTDFVSVMSMLASPETQRRTKTAVRLEVYLVASQTIRLADHPTEDSGGAAETNYVELSGGTAGQSFVLPISDLNKLFMLGVSGAGEVQLLIYRI